MDGARAGARRTRDAAGSAALRVRRRHRSRRPIAWRRSRVAAPPSAHLDVLEAFLRDVEAPPPDGAARERWLRARGAVLAIAAAACASRSRAFGESPRPFADLAALLRRLLEEQPSTRASARATCTSSTREAAPYGRFTHVTLAGVVEGEWPVVRRAQHLLSVVAAARSGLAGRDRPARRRRARCSTICCACRCARVEVSTFSLDDEAIVRPSPFVEDLDARRPAIERVGDRGATSEPTRTSPLHVTALPLDIDARPPTIAVDEAGRRCRARRRLAGVAAGAEPIDLPAFHGAAGAVAPRAYSVTSLDRYRQCPFKYFAADVLRSRRSPTIARA